VSPQQEYAGDCEKDDDSPENEDGEDDDTSPSQLA
jgi:hypothetical protein